MNLKDEVVCTKSDTSDLKTPVIAMYDVRGIQNYIFRTQKVKDAMGASALVETIITDALREAVKACDCEEQSVLDWHDETGVLPYEEDEAKVKVLYIGGGNAYVIYQTKELYTSINRVMARYILDHTYSLELAAAYVPVTDDYQADYDKLRKKMDAAKANMPGSLPYGPLPIMRAERETGYPIIDIRDEQEISQETKLKQEMKGRLGETEDTKQIEDLITQKGVDSMLAVVHIDGNGMGQRIREKLQNANNYTEAINQMRSLSYHIRYAYENVFQRMYDLFHTKSASLKVFSNKETPLFVRKILTAGDDITYICNAKIALATVEYFCREITKFTMTGKTDADSIWKEGFSVCAGVAFMKVHFPFRAAYEVAEACCASAKKKAKQPEFVRNGRTANFVDFQICRNMQGKALESVRRKEYVTYTGENLLMRPYYIPVEADGEKFSDLKEAEYSFTRLKEAVLYFQNKKYKEDTKELIEEMHIPSSFANDLKLAYAMGQSQVVLLQHFLNSRGIFMPDGTDCMYCGKTAKWYDALEMLDLFVTLEEVEEADQ